MSETSKLSLYLFGLFFLIAGGCQSEHEVNHVRHVPATSLQGNSIHTGYEPAKIEILPLTGVVSDTNSIGSTKIKAYISLLDGYNCQIKAPMKIRFEMYDYVQLSANPKGRRLMLWPDVDLQESSQNNQYWRDFLRAYEIDLNLENFLIQQQDYVLEATCTTADGRRLTAEVVLGGKKL